MLYYDICFVLWVSLVWCSSLAGKTYSCLLLLYCVGSRRYPSEEHAQNQSDNTFHMITSRVLSIKLPLFTMLVTIT